MRKRTEPREHGTRASYVKDGCRCDACREANRLYLLARKRRLGVLSLAEYRAALHEHPSLNCYKRHGCRCERCCRFNTYACRREAMLRAWR